MAVNLHEFLAKFMGCSPLVSVVVLDCGGAGCPCATTNEDVPLLGFVHDIAKSY
jgi:hypothetical protein